MDVSAERRAKHEATFRKANERVAQRARALGFGDESVPYICECADADCTAIITLTMVQYQQVRNHPRRFIIRPGHQSAPDHIVTDHSGFMVVEKTGEEGELVEQQDPRTATG